MTDGWRGNKQGVGETGGICWKNKEEALGNLDGRNICKYENNK